MEVSAIVRTHRLVYEYPNITLNYPIITGLTNRKSQQEINYIIFSTMNQLLLDQNYNSPDLREMLADFEIKNNQRGILSLNLIVYSFTGGAHGMTVVKSLTFDLETGKQYTLAELFKEDSPYVQVISEYVRRHIAKWEIMVLEPFTRIRPDQDFYIADTSIIIYFQLYEISPYVQGFPYFPIPLLDLKEFIQPGSPADRMMVFT